ncbi:GumC family protein [Chroococcus sp. FPU101]|uniref:GumC family protein n=1 Tax=Chroococcus sp. FPU101 TaxID=1974212 RepID=UPI001A8EC85E|nr:P-loop NTPase [Chroococcus sp. FPU101]GFE69617.1 lipopolysaccharide biosynthesis protein [Chroococcus sp. FPU101]
MNHTLSIVRRHWPPLLVFNLLLISSVVYVIVNIKELVAPIWKANAELSIPIKGDKLNANLGTLGNLSDGNIDFTKEVNPLYTQSAILMSDTVLGRVLASDPQKSEYTSLEDYKALFKIQPQAQTTIMSLEVEATTPELAYQRVKTLINSYQKRLDELRQQDVKAQEKFAENSLKKAQNNLIVAQNKLNQFQQSTGLLDSETQTQELIHSINQLKAKKAEISSEAESHAIQAKVAAAQLGMAPEQALNSLRLAENKEYQSVRDKLAATEIELSESRGIYTDKMPQIQSLMLKRNELRRAANQQMARVLPSVPSSQIDVTLGPSSTDTRTALIADVIRSQSTAKGLKQQSNLLEKELNKLNNEVDLIAQNQGMLIELKRKYEIAEGVYKGITAQLSQNKINAFNAYPSVQLLDGPTLDPKPTTASRKLIAFGGLLASILGSVSILLFLESRNPLFNSKDLQLAGFPLILRFPRLKGLFLEKGLDEKTGVEFQRLAATVSSFHLENRCLMITSATRNEGKTTLTLGLAWALVQLGYRVLLIDADLRQAQMSRQLGYPQFRRGTDYPETLLPIHPGFDLMLAPLIQPNKIGEYFLRGEFEQRLKRMQASDNYDFILVDSPPVNLTSEASLMSRLIQNVMFVVRPGNSDRYSVIDSIEQLKQQEAQVKGLIVNGVETRTANYRYYDSRQEFLEAES